MGSNELAKTTLFKILVGELEPDEGTIKWGVTTSQAYFPKDNTAEFDNDLTIVDWLMGYSPVKDVTYVRGFLGRMLFAGEDGVKKVKVLSGGEKVRCLLSKMMISGANCLILDEPTNHLDLSAIRWLENFLLDFENTVIVVSHDRHFLNKVCTHICDVDFGKIQMYVGNYDFWYEYTQMRQRQARDQNKKNGQKIGRAHV